MRISPARCLWAGGGAEWVHGPGGIMPAPREMAETRYVTVGDADVAYRVMGDGPLDLLHFYGLGSHVDMHWDDPRDGQTLDALASFSRLIFFDRRGTGASDALAPKAMPAWEEWADDLRAVLDAVGSERTAILAAVDAGPIAIMFAALQPERVSALILSNTSPRYLEADDYPIGVSQADADALVETVGSLWGTEAFATVINPALVEDVESARSFARRLRAAATPRNAAAQPVTSWTTSMFVRFCTSSRLQRSFSTRVKTRWSQSNMADTSPLTSRGRSSLKLQVSDSSLMPMDRDRRERAS